MLIVCIDLIMEALVEQEAAPICVVTAQSDGHGSGYILQLALDPGFGCRSLAITVEGEGPKLGRRHSNRTRRAGTNRLGCVSFHVA